MDKFQNQAARIMAGTAVAVGGWWATKSLIQSINKYPIENKVVLITGGTRGLGIILARQLSDAGAKVVICSRSEESVQRASEDLSSRTDDFLAIQCDVSSRQQVADMIQLIGKELGNVDILINNAGIIEVGPMETMEKSDFEQAMQVHFWGPYNLIQEVLPGMIERGKGRIVNIVSIGGKISPPHLLPYNASKYALSGLSEGLTAELKKYNIRVTTVYPGLMRTGSPRNVDVKGQFEKEYAWFKIADSLPVLSMDADRAASRIISAMQKGKKTVVLSLPAKLAVAIHGLAPGFTISFFNLIDRLLPGKIGSHEAQKGYESTSTLSESLLTQKTDEAAQKNLET